MRTLTFWKTTSLVCVFSVAGTIGASAQTLTTLLNFDGSNGSAPEQTLVVAVDGSYYGTTFSGGTHGYGTIFRIDRSKLTTLHSFDSTDGSRPTSLVQGRDGSFYGTATDGGANGDGTIFKITPGGTLTTLHNFNGLDGMYPIALILGADGNFYGTSLSGGAYTYYGTVFRVTPSGVLTTLHSFDYDDGAEPAGLLQASDGNFYGTTAEGGANDDGTAFRVTPGGTLTTIHTFDYTDGSASAAPLIQAKDGNFYGTTSGGGAYCESELGCGTVFRMTPSGALTTLHSFDFVDGFAPVAALLQASNGDFYGTTEFGGSSACPTLGCGTIFKITAQGTLTTLHTFESTDGSNIIAGLIRLGNGAFYGAAANGGTSQACTTGCGTLFKLSVQPGQP